MVSVVGIGSLGHIGIKLANAMGAHEVVVSRNADEMTAHAKSPDLILDTVAAPHDLDAFFALLNRDGTMTLVGAPATPHPSPEVFSLIMKRRGFAAR